MTGPLLFPGVDEQVMDAALVTISGHVPPSIEVGIPFAVGRQDLADGTRAVLVLTRRGGWTVTSRWVERTRRLDSELGELWDTSPPGHFDFVTWADGVQTHQAERTFEATP